MTHDNDEGFRSLCDAVIILAAKEYYTQKYSRIGINKFVTSQWFLDLVEGSNFPNMTPELFWQIGSNKKIKSYKVISNWEKSDSKRRIDSGQTICVKE